MIADQGVTILAIAMDAEPAQCVVEGPDGKQQVCAVTGWFAAGDPPRRVGSYMLADTFSFDVFGFDTAGVPAQVRYDGRLEGLGQPIPRAADGTFGNKPGRMLADGFEDKAAMLPN